MTENNYGSTNSVHLQKVDFLFSKFAVKVVLETFNFGRFTVFVVIIVLFSTSHWGDAF